jgi:hypothetical protein
MRTLPERAVEAAAMAAAAQARTRLVENALTATLAMIVEKLPLADAQRGDGFDHLRRSSQPIGMKPGYSGIDAKDCHCGQLYWSGNLTHSGGKG